MTTTARVAFGATHTLVANPIRLARAPTELRVGQEWRRDMRRCDQLRVSAITLPLLIVYGYMGKETA